MAKGHFGAWPDQQLRTYGDLLTEHAERAAAAVGGWRVHTIRLGRVLLTLRATDERVHAMLLRATRHLAVAEADPADSVVISVCDTASTGVEPPREPDWAASHWRHEGEHTVLYIDRDRNSVAYSDVHQRRAIWWIAAEADVPLWERPAPLRTLIDRLLGPAGATLVHGGVVGDERGGVVLAGRGGSGKSTSIVSCVADGLRCGGDDFLLLQNDERPAVAWSMYATARLVPTSPAWSCFTPLDRCIELPPATETDDPNLLKRAIFLAEQFPGCMADRFVIRAVVVPMVVAADDTSLVPLRPALALRALAPSSMLQLDPRASALRTMAALVGSVPCFTLQVGRDLAQIPAAVRGLLRDSSADGG